MEFSRSIRKLAVSALATGVMFSATLGEVAASTRFHRDALDRFETVADAVHAGRVERAVADRLAGGQAADVLVLLDGDEDPAPGGSAEELLERVRRDLGAVKDRAFDADGVTIIDEYPTLEMAHVRIATPSALLDVANDPAVEAIQFPDRGQVSLDRSLPIVRQPDVRALGHTGAGTYVGVIDTGVDHTRAAFGSCVAAGGTCKVAGNWEMAPNDYSLDDNGHGTNVAGIVLGVAPGTRIIAYDVFRVTGYDANGDPIHQYDETWVIAALEHLISQQATLKTIKAVNLSLGQGPTYHNTTCSTRPNGTLNPFTDVFARARQVGIVPVVAAGNDGTRNGTYRDGISYPACTAGAVSVGAVYDSALGAMGFTNCTDLSTRQDQVTCFSQSAPILSVLAPGSTITAAGITQSGTSQATPHVAGAIAVLAAARPSHSLTQIVTAVVSTGPWIGDSRSGTVRYTRRLDLAAALASLAAATTPTDTIKPVFSAAPAQVIAAGWSLGTASQTPVTFSWRATDASGIERYAVQLAVNGTWRDHTAALGSPTAEQLTFTDLQPGNTYQLAVAAKDRAGNWTDWKLGPVLALSSIAENGAGVTYPRGGFTLSAWSSALGGYLAASATPGAYTRLTFTGRNVAWIGTTAANRGVAQVYLDGVLVKTIDLYGSTVARKIQFTAAVDPSRSHTLDILVVGTSGRPTVDVDGFIVLR